jgi:hypothetical protein
MQRAFNKEQEQKETAKIKKIEDASKWSLKSVFRSKKRKRTTEPVLGYSEISEGTIQGRRSFGDFAKKDEPVDNKSKDHVEDEESQAEPLKKRKTDQRPGKGLKGISNLFQ